MSGGRPVLQRAALVALGILLALLLAEVALRAVVPASDARLFVYARAGGRYKVMKPDYRGTVYGVPIVTNALGFRDRRTGPVPPKRAGTRRAIVLGDSYTTSAGIPFDSLYTTVAGRAAAREGAPVEVLNLACPGFNLIQYRAQLEELGWSLSPDVVVIGLYLGNDFEIHAYREARANALRGIREDRPRWYHGLHLYRMFEMELAGLGARARRVLRLERADEVRARRLREEAEGLEENSRAFEGIAADCRARGVPLLVLMLPGTYDFAAQEGLEAHARRLCEANAVAAVSARAALAAYPERGPDYRMNLMDRHPDTRYHRRVGELLGAALAGMEGLRR